MVVTPHEVHQVGVFGVITLCDHKLHQSFACLWTKKVQRSDSTKFTDAKRREDNRSQKLFEFRLT
jgi:hypothetical protein